MTCAGRRPLAVGLCLAAAMVLAGRAVPTASAGGDAAAMERMRNAGRNRVAGLQAMKQGDFPTAAQRLRLAVQQRPDESALRLDLAISLFATGQYYQAAGVIKDAFRGFTREIIAQAHVASYFPSTTVYRRSLANLEQAQRSAPADLDLAMLLGVITLVGGQQRTAQELFENMLAVDPLQPVARYFLGRTEPKPRIAPYLLATSTRTPGADVVYVSPSRVTRTRDETGAKAPAAATTPVFPKALPPSVCFPVLREQVSVVGD